MVNFINIRTKIKVMQKTLLLFFFSWFLSGEEAKTPKVENFEPPVITICGEETIDKNNFANVSAVQNGNWDNPNTWSSGSVPTGVDNVTIPQGIWVYLKGNCFSKNLTVNGRLRNTAAEDDFHVLTEWILISGANADLQVGTTGNPYTGRGRFQLFGANDGQNVSGSGDKFIAAMNNGTIRMHGDNTVKTWTHLDGLVPVGSNQITLQEAVNWPNNAKIVVTSTRFSGDEAEQKTIQSVSPDGKTLTLTSNFMYPHSGEDKIYSSGSKTWTANLRAEVGLLTRNITIEGDPSSDTNGFGAHMMVHYSGKAYISGIELFRVGQKSIVGRYPFHWHLVKNLGTGQYFKNSSVHKSFNRALTIHGTENTLVENNFFYDHIGHGLFLEDGTERFNIIRKNVVVLTKRPADGEQVTISDNELNELQNRAPSSYWITNPNNTFEDNVAAGTASYNGQGHGTGFWFIMPIDPIGDSAGDPYFSGLKPYLEPLGMFKGNKAHSCMSAFDFFDRLDTDHSIIKNAGWNSAQWKLIEDCTWYSNDVGVYGGIGGAYVDRVLFRDNIYVDNKTHVFLANYCQTDQSLFVADSGLGNISGNRWLYATYDGAGKVRDSYFVGWDANNANLIRPIGAATKHVNHHFSGITTDHPGTLPRLEYPDYTINQSGYADANDNTHPRMWNNILMDDDGTLTGTAGTSVVANHPLHLVGDETQPANWTNAYKSNHDFVLGYLHYSGALTNFPNISMERTKVSTPTAGQYYINGYKEKQQLPIIVNEGFMYTYRFESLPGNNTFDYHMDDANVGDTFLARFENLGKFTWLSIPGTQHNSLASLNAATSTGYFRQNNGDLYFRPVATTLRQSWSFAWLFDVSLPALDTDGDGHTDFFESNRGRNPIDPKDFAFQFNEQNTEGWTLTNSSGNMTSYSVMGTSTTSDPQFYKNDFHFLASEVNYIIVRMKATSNGSPHLFWGRDNAPGFSGGRQVFGTYTGNGDWQYVFFNVGADPEWNSRITNLRFDPFTGNGITFEIDWIISSLGDLDGDGILDPSDACLFTPHVQPTTPTQFNVCSMDNIASLVGNPTGGYWTGTGIIGTKLYINAGGNAVVMNGFDWLADQHFVNGNVTPFNAGLNIANTATGDIYKSERWMNGNLQYNIPVSPGEYEVELHFAETWGSAQAAGVRVFDVSMEGTTVESQVDIYDQAGGNTALIKPYVVKVTDGLLNLQLNQGVQNPKLCGIAILPKSVDPSGLSVGTHEVTYNYRDPRTGCYDTQVSTINVNPPPSLPTVNAAETICELGPQKVLTAFPKGGEWSGTGIVGSPIYINAGSLSVEEGGHTWIADQNFINGTTYSYSPIATVANTSAQELYRSERYAASDLLYQIPVPNGAYEVELHFAEIWPGAHNNGVRVFGINLEGTVVENAFDIYATGGASTAVIKTYSTSVNDGMLNIDLIKGVQNPKISAIAVLPKTFDPATAGAGAHTLTYKYTNPFSGCSSSKTTTMTVAPAPLATATGTTTICTTTATTLQGSATGTGAKTYKWFIAGTNTLVSNQQNYTINPTQTTSYELEATVGSCPSLRSAPVTVTVNSLPQTPTIAGAQTVCELGAISLTANPVGGAWSGTGIVGSPLYINAGGPAIAEGGIFWIADQNFTNGGATNFGAASVSNTASQSIYQTERWASGILRYDIPVVPGEYQIQIHLAEMHGASQTTGARVFDIRIEGAIVENTIDIFDEAGAATALIKTYNINITDTNLDLDFLNNPGNPKVSAIAVLPKSFSGEVAGPGAHVLTYNYTDPLTGCSKSNTTTFTVSAAPVATAAGSTAICAGESALLSGSTTGTGAKTYKWYLGMSNTVVSTQQNPTVSPTTTSTYELETTAAGCLSYRTAPITITVNPLPATPTVSPPETLCETAAQEILTASPDGGQWSGPGIIGSPIFINSGGPTVSEGGISWLADQHFINGNTFGAAVPIANTASESIYHTERWSGGNLNYEIPMPSGEYQVQIHLAELYAPLQVVGARLFNISLEGSTVDSNVDIFDEAGPATALIKTYSVSVSDGVLDLDFLKGASDNPKVSAIAVLPMSFDASSAGAGSHTLTYDYIDPTTGCEKSNTTTMTVNAAPTAVASGSISVCSGREIDLSGSTPNNGTNISYDWYLAGTNMLVSSQQNPTIAPTTDTDYQLVVTVDGCSSFPSAAISVDVDPANAVCFEAKTMLEGPFASASMIDNLKENGFLVLAEPYTAIGFTGLGNAGMVIPNSVLSGTGANNDIVDWVVVQLRDKNNPLTIVAAAAMLLEQDGEIITYEQGRKSNILSFNVAHDNYYLAIFHRNHLPVMTANPVPFSGVPSIFDFTSNGMATYGTGARIQLSTGLWGMITGDASSDNSVDAQDRSETWNSRNQSGYLLPDVTLDGNVDAADRSKTWNNRNQAGTVDR